MLWWMQNRYGGGEDGPLSLLTDEEYFVGILLSPQAPRPDGSSVPTCLFQLAQRPCPSPPPTTTTTTTTSCPFAHLSDEVSFLDLPNPLKYILARLKHHMRRQYGGPSKEEVERIRDINWKVLEIRRLLIHATKKYGLRHGMLPRWMVSLLRGEVSYGLSCGGGSSSSSSSSSMICAE